MTLLLSSASIHVWADEIKSSSLGYQVNLPRTLVMVPRELFTAQTKLPAGHFLQEIIPPLIQSGQAQTHDFFFWKGTLFDRYKDHIRIGLLNEAPPKDRVSAEQFCNNFHVILSTVYQKYAQIYQCAFIKNGHQNILYTEYDGSNNDSLIMTVHVPLTDRQALEVTASVNLQHINQRRTDFLSFINQLSASIPDPIHK